MASEKNDQERREIIRRLEQDQRDADADALRLRAELAKADEKYRLLEAAHLRATGAIPNGDFCLECWIKHGTKFPMKNVPSQPIVPMEDRFVCSECGRQELRKA